MIRTAPPAARIFALLGALAIPAGARAQAPAPPVAPDLPAVVAKGYDYLKAKQNPDGSLAPKLGGPGVTALVVAALVRHGKTPDDPVVAKGLAYLESRIQPDGGVYDKALANYTTCLAILAFTEANQSGKYTAAIANAAKFVRTLQSGETDPANLSYGGVGYDGKSRPDVSNTQFFVEALRASGAGADDPGIKKALVFLGRSQNLPGEFNDQPFARLAADDDLGGVVYNPLDQSRAKSEKRSTTGGLRSEGGMTYAGLKSFLYAGLSAEDARVKSALKWIRRHYTLKSNPGMGEAGLYYYYHTFAKAMTVLGQAKVKDDAGAEHDWKAELVAELTSRQQPDGSWANANRAYLENQPELATAFALLALSYCR